MQVDVVPEGLAAASAQVAALTARLVGTNAAHAVATGAILPPGADAVSVKTAASLVAEGVAHQAMAGLGNTQLASSSEGVGESGLGYALVDGIQAGAYGVSAGIGV